MINGERGLVWSAVMRLVLYSVKYCKKIRNCWHGCQAAEYMGMDARL